ncbi:MAG: ABC transporter permease [Promethearchaeota archaeon]
MSSSVEQITEIKEKKNVLLRIKSTFSHSYAKFIMKKAGFYLLVIFCALTLTFLIPRLMPGDPTDRLLRPPPNVSDPKQLEQYYKMKDLIIAYYGLDKPIFPDQFVEFWDHMFHLDLGTSYSLYPVSVVDAMIPRIWMTLILVIPVLFISFFLGNWIGGKAAFGSLEKGYSAQLADLVYYVNMILQSAPFYWLALIVYLYFVIELRKQGVTIFPINHPGGVGPEMIPSVSIEYFIELLRHYALPFITLLVTFTGGWATGMRAMTLYEMESEYLLYSEQMGFRKKKLQSYAQRNAILPQFTGLNLRFNDLVGATILTEAIFGWPGLGSMQLNAIMMLDFPLIIGTFIITLVIVVFGNFIVDITYGFIDPRIRTGHGG